MSIGSGRVNTRAAFSLGWLPTQDSVLYASRIWCIPNLNSHHFGLLQGRVKVETAKRHTFES